jgi:hypothetical protein
MMLGPSDSKTIKVKTSTVMPDETEENLQHSKRLIPESVGRACACGGRIFFNYLKGSFIHAQFWQVSKLV